MAPSTDPGWTPLLLVMEMGGVMSHKAVAVEHGIHAVMGVALATRRSCTGRRIRLDGGAGTVSLEP